jgi:ABC-type sulfate transport system permease component
LPTAIYLGFERRLDSALTLAAILIVIYFLSILVTKLFISHEAERELLAAWV